MILMYFKANYCGGCRTLSELLKEVPLPYPLVEVDVEENSTLAAQRFVTEVPTLMLIYGDTVVAKKSGLFNKDDLIAFLNEGKLFNETC